MHSSRGRPGRPQSRQTTGGRGTRAGGAACSGACARASRRAARRSGPSSREPLRPARRRDLGAARGGADPGRRRRAATAEVVGRLETEVEAGTRQRRRGGARAAGRAARRGRRRRRAPRIDLRARPAVIMVVGVNGTGKTTTIGKLAWHLRSELGLLGDRGRRRHLPRRRDRAARDLGRARRGRDRSRAARAATRARSSSTRSPRPRRAAPTW